MIVYYRLCSLRLPTSNPFPIMNDEPDKVHRMCLESFIEAFKDIGPKMVFLMDYCSASYTDMVEELVPFDFEMHHTQLGINRNCLHQYQLYEKTKEDKVLFQECDYMFKPTAGKEIMMALDELDFLTPYDHPDKYESEKDSIVKAVNGRYWKKTISTTSTFATTRQPFEKYKEIFYKHGYIDHARWVEIAENGGELWSALPALATHMAKDWISPHVDWGF